MSLQSAFAPTTDARFTHLSLRHHIAFALASAACVPVANAQETADDAVEPIRVAAAEAAVSNAGANANEPLERVVVVRSRNRLEPLQDVPLSISVVTGAELERENAVELGDITKRAANVTYNTGNPRQGSLSIRGVGKQGQTDAQDPSVGVIVDGVNYAYNALSFYDFTDVEAVEVTRGPQGTLLGKNTTMGVVNITTRQPSFTPDAIYSITLGDKDALIGKAAGGGPIFDDLLAWRGTFYVDKQDGAFKNLYDNGDRSYTDKNRMYGRVQLLFTPSQNFTAKVSVDLTPRAGENSNGLTFYKQVPEFYSDGSRVNLANDASTRLARRWFAQESNYTYADDYLGAARLNAVNNDNQRALFTGTKGASVWLDWNVGNFTVTSISAYKDYYFDARNDEGTPFNISLNGNTTVHYKQVSQELRLSSQTGGVIDYQTGLFILNSENTYNAKQEWGSDAGAWFATGPQYSTLDTNGSGRYLLENSLARLFRLQTDHIDNESAALFGQANLHLNDRSTVTAGVRFTREDRNNETARLIKTNGYAAELNPVQVNGVATGGFASTSTGALGTTNTTEQLALADLVANKYFGVAATGTPGGAYNALTAAQQLQVAAAKAVRQAQLGTLWHNTQGESFEETQPAFVLSQNYAVTPDFTSYVSWQYGEKAGISQFTNGLPNNAKPEKSSAYEIGLKSVLFDRDLVVNFDFFLNEIRDYQQSVQVLDEYTTRLRNDQQLYYTSATGNVAKVHVKGFEVDGTYSGLPHTAIRFSAAINDAVYEDFKNAGQPSENGFAGAAAYRDVSGETLPGAPKYTFTLGAEYRLPVFASKEFHTSFNHFQTSKYNSDNLLSSYGWVAGYGITDFSIGLGAADRSFDVSLIVKNAFDTQYAPEGWTSYTPSIPRWYGVSLSGRL